MEVEKISEIFIKPSSPTPLHLKNYKISLLDQIHAHAFPMPSIFCYSNKDINLNSKMSMLLKQSLSETLTHYYPLAGRIKDSLSIDCNDEGVCYIETRANISLSQYLIKPDLPSMASLLPRNDKWWEPYPATPYVVMIKQTMFTCGSITIGVLGSHMVMDGTAFVSFLKCWAAIARNSTKDIIPPNFDGPSTFPQYEPFPNDFLLPFHGATSRIGKLATRRFVFNTSAIADLKDEARNSGVENPTRTDVVPALLLECIADILKERSSNIDQPLAFYQAINLRRKVTPPMPESTLGNLFWPYACSFCSPEEIKRVELVRKQREGIRKFDSIFVEDIRNGGFNKLCELLKELMRDLTGPSSTFSKNGVNYVGMTNCCNFGIDEVDFGWGKPIWVTFAVGPPPNYSEIPYTNFILLMDGATDKRVEAWVFMEEDELLLLEKHKHLLKYASLNPTPLKLAKL